MEARDKAIDGTKGFNLGMIVNTPITPEHKAEQLAYDNASNQVNDPAYSYNEHVKVCDVCKQDPPHGRYSYPLVETTP